MRETQGSRLQNWKISNTKQEFHIQKFLSVFLYNHFPTIAVAVLVQENMEFSLHDVSWLKSHVCLILREAKGSSVFGERYFKTNITY